MNVKRHSRGFDRRTIALGLLLLLASLASAEQPLVDRVDTVSMTVGDIDRAVDFYSKVLTFEKVSDTEVAGETYEHLQGVFGLRMRVVRMRLGDEYIELAEYLAPKGRPIAVDAHSNDRSFQHIAIIVSDMDKAYRRLRENKVEHASTGRSACRTGIRTRPASGLSISRIRTVTRWKFSNFRRTRAWTNGIVQATKCSLALITRRSS